MRFGRFYAHGFGVFNEPFEVNLDAIPGPLVAVVGANGSGKTTLLELLAGAVYRETATHGSLADLATMKGAVLEVDVVNGASHRITHTVNGLTGAGSVLLRDEAGRPLLTDTKVTNFDGYVKRHFPAKAVVMASLFGAQGADGLLDMDPGPAKGVLLRLLGCEDLEAKAKRAGELGREAKARWQLAAKRLDDEWRRDGGLSVEDALSRLADARAAVVAAEAVEATARAEVEALRVRVDAHRELARRRAEVEERRAVAQRGVDDARAKLRGLETRLLNNQDLLPKEAAIRAAAARAAEIAARVPVLQAAVQQVQSDQQTVRAEVSRATSARDAARARAEAATRRAQAAEAQARARETEAADAAAILPALRDELARAERAVSEAAAEVERLQGVVLQGAEGRIRVLRDGLDYYANGGEDGGASARVVLDDDDAAVVAAEEIPRRLQAARGTENVARPHAATVRAQLTGVEVRAARMAEVEPLRRQAADAHAEAEAARAEAGRHEAEAEAARHRGEAIGPALDRIQAEARALSDENTSLVETAKLLPHLDAVRGRIAELEFGLADARQVLAAREEALAAIEAPPEVGPDPAATRGAIEFAHAHAVTALATARARVVTEEAAVVRAEETAKRCAELEAEVAAASDEMADWVLLAESLGRDGLQAMLIDAAGPELTELVNDLLHTCHGPRFSMSVNASRLTADGRKEVEGLEISVLDTREGREGPGKSFSGGEKTILREALALAVGMLVCKRTGVSPTIVRDETGSALDPENAIAYIAMLRRAVEFTGASHCLFVTHSPEIAAMADGTIDMGARAGAPSAAA